MNAEGELYRVFEFDEEHGDGEDSIETEIIGSKEGSPMKQ